MNSKSQSLFTNSFYSINENYLYIDDLNLKDETPESPKLQNSFSNKQDVMYVDADLNLEKNLSRDKIESN